MSTTSRQRRSSRRSSNELLGLVVSCIGAYAMLLSLLPTLVGSTLGQFLLVGTLIGGGLHIVLGPRQGKTVVRAVIEVVAVAAITFALVYGCMWYFTVYLASQPNILQFNLGKPTATP